MISVKYIWDRISAYGQKYQVGLDVVAYFNSALAEVQAEIFNDFSPLYDKNEKIKALLDVWVKEQVGSSTSGGVVTVGTGADVVNRPLSAGYVLSGNISFSIPNVTESELVAIARIPQRTPDVSKKNVYYRFNAPATLQFYPKTTIPYDLFYLVYPTVASIAFTFSETDDEDIMTYDSVNSVQLAWPASATNLILYLMLEKYGVSVREELLQAYSKYGFVQSAQAGEVQK
jgi:hypothetical protein